MGVTHGDDFHDLRRRYLRMGTRARTVEHGRLCGQLEPRDNLR